MNLPLYISIKGGTMEIPAILELGFSEEVKGDQGTGVYYVDEVASVDLELDDECYRTEVEAEVEDLDYGYLTTKAMEYAKGDL